MFGHLGKIFGLVMVTIINCIQNVISTNCPLLRSFTDNSGILFVNKTLMMYTEVPVHCQWLIASSAHQVSNFLMNNYF